LGEPRQAVDVLSRVISRKPAFYQARLDLGAALLQINKINEARNQFQQVLGQQPGNARAHLGMAQAAFSEGQWEAAVSLAQTARVYGGPNFAVLYMLGRAARLAKNGILAEDALKEADALLEKSVELSPNMPEGYYLRGELLFIREQFGQAMEQFMAAENRAEPGRVYSAFGETFTRIDILAKRALCLQRQGDVLNARALGKQILESDPENKLGKALAEL
jgi:tetratricopeptide (TPR) repeat protein